MIRLRTPQISQTYTRLIIQVCRKYSTEPDKESISRILDATPKSRRSKVPRSSHHVHRIMSDEKQTTRNERLTFDKLLDSIFETNENAKLKNNKEAKGAIDGGHQEISQRAASSPYSSQQQTHDNMKTLLAPVLDYMCHFETDQELLNYYTTKILRPDVLNSKNTIPELVDPESPPIVPDALPIYLEQLLSNLTHQFDSPNAAITAFELSKRASLEFYTAACDITIYNKMISIKWRYYRDLYSIDSILSEMQANAVFGDEDTISAIGVINSDFQKLQHQGLRWSREETERMKNMNNERTKLIKQIPKISFNTLYGSS